MLASSRSYAIGMAHFWMAGGWKMLSLVCGLYVVLFFSGVGLYYYMEVSSGRSGAISPGVVSLLFGIQAVVMLLLGGSRVSAVIRRDLSTGMIESHRLMPIPSWRAVAGYLVGGTMGAVAFGLVNALLALIMGGASGTPLVQILMYQAVLFAFAFLAWSFSAVTTFQFRYTYFIVIGLVVLGLCSGTVSRGNMLLPGLSLLLSPLFGETIFYFGGSPVNLFRWIYPAAFACQAVLFTLYFAGACRRYRGTYATTFSVLQSMLLLLVWSGASAMGLVLRDELTTPRYYSMGNGYERVQVIGSLATAMLLASIPLATIAVERRLKKIGPAIVAVLLVLCTLAISLAMMGGLASAAGSSASWVTLLLVAAHVVTVYAGFRLVRRLPTLVAWLLVGFGVMAFWIAPLVLELVYLIAVEPLEHRESLGIMGSISPLGLLINVWSAERPFAPAWGVAVQWLLAGLLSGAMLLVKDRPTAMPQVVDAKPTAAITADPPADTSS